MKINRWTRWIQTFHYPSYFIFFVTARCNARCPMCFYMENMESNAAKRELRVEEYEKISRSIPLINILGISGGEPFLREDLHEIVQVMYKNCSPWVVDLPTNGFLTKSVLKQVEEIARRCPDMVVDLQLSIDGPPEIHNQIRGLKDGFGRMRETYLGLVALKKRYRNLKVKACVVYSHYNQDHIEPLFDMLHSDFTDLDRIVFSVAHGSVYNDEAMAFDWERYFKNCARIREASTVKDIKDLHSIFTIALRIVKNDLLKEILRKKNMVQLCGAGQKVVVINELGQVFPCEPLWRPVGDLTKNGYDLNQILRSEAMKQFQDQIVREKCNCHWGLPMSTALIYSPRYYPKILFEMTRILSRSLFRSKKMENF
ncbi:MAG TPA: hypothetical protein DD723_03320 [Candidatus Omnitrophica bacterium]|nr:MAG: hypothetical protein A2Z81_00955 [Omnitrophica WOR_2 bacterium GWA2_45_18]HBR14560.1 hypothetical protein [Candidatus Omnitrophota bacterium]